MGWGTCGTDSRGRNIGYLFPARCDHPGCHRRIDRGLSYVCGDMHGDDEVSCEKYFCSKHKTNYVEIDDVMSSRMPSDKRLLNICDECAKVMREDGSDLWEYDEDDGVFREKKEKVK